MKKHVNPMYFVRMWTNDYSNHPVKIIPGDSEPVMKGKGSYHTTKNGSIVYHPSAYGYPTIYHASTIHTEVGKNWLHKHRGVKYHRSKDGTLCVIFPKKYHVKIHGFKCIPGFVNKGYKIWLIQSKDFEYHASRYGNDHQDARRAIRIVIDDIRKQRKIEKERIEFEIKAKEVYVGINDSINAGNCRIGTEQWGNRNKLDSNKKYPADFILNQIKNGDRAYVERAVKFAIKRHEKEMQIGYCELN